MTENINYYLHAKPDHLHGMILARGLVYGMNHACFSACFGLGLGIACDATTSVVRRWAPIAGLVAGMGLHMAHNLIVTAHAVPIRFAALGLAGCAAFIWFRLVSVARAREAHWIEEELADEVKGK
jgi:protease PrsW